MRSVLLGHRLLPWLPKLRPVVEPVVLDLLTSVASVAKRTIVGLLAITKPHLGREHKKGSNHSGYTSGFRISPYLFCFWRYIHHWAGLNQFSHI